MRFIGICSCVLMLFLSTGCVPKLRNVSPDKSLAFIYLDLSEVKVVPTWVTLKQILPKTDRPYFYMGYIIDKNNKYAATFVYDTLAPGTYQMALFGGEGRVFMQKTQAEFRMPETGKNETAIVIDHPANYYMGAYKYRSGNSNWAGFINLGKFALEPSPSPSREEALALLLPMAEGTKWEERINNDLASKKKP